MTERQNLPEARVSRTWLDRIVLRRTLFVLVLAVGLYILLPKVGSLADGLLMMRRASPIWLLAALGCEIVSLGAQAYVVRTVLVASGPRSPLGRIMKILLAASFILVFVPSAGLSGHALRLKYLGESGYTVETALLSYVVESVTLGLGLAIVVIAGLMQMATGGGEAPWWTFSTTFGAIFLGFLLLVVAARALSRPGALEPQVARALALANRVRAKGHRAPWSAEGLRQRLAALTSTLHALDGPTRWRVLLGSLVRASGEALCLHLTFRAFGQPVPLPVSIVAYGLSTALGGLSSSPGGLVVMEGSLSAILVQQGLPLTTALAVTLVFRLLNFWAPRGAGLLAWWNLQRHSSRPLW